MCDMSHVTHLTHYVGDISHATHMTHCVCVCVLAQVQGEKHPAQIFMFHSKIEMYTPTHMQRLQCTYVFQCAPCSFERHETTHMTSHDTVTFSCVNLSVWLSICLFFMASHVCHDKHLVRYVHRLLYCYNRSVFQRATL